MACMHALYYDREKYLEMVLDVAETILGVFGFSARLGIVDQYLLLYTMVRTLKFKNVDNHRHKLIVVRFKEVNK